MGERLVNPRWSVMLPAFNPNAWLREALASVLAARDACGESMQIEVVDDASPDVDVAAMLVAWGYDDIPVFRRAVNGGLGRCWNTCIARAEGDFVHVLHQDDLVAQNFYARMSATARAFPGAGMLFCRTRFIEGSSTGRVDVSEQDHPGSVEDWLEKICSAQRLQCPSVIVRRDVYASIGSFDESLRYVIDWEMWIRIAAHRTVAYVPEVLAAYRIHGEAESSRLKSAGAITKDLSLGLARITETLRAVGRLDCVPAVRAYAWHVTGQIAHEAEKAGRLDVAASEISASFRRFARGAGVLGVARRLRWYLSLRLRTFGWSWHGLAPR